MIEILKSVSNQSSQNYRCTVLDDSNNQRFEIEKLNFFQAESFYYKKNDTNIGMVNNWNQALNLGKDIVAIIHADDILKPNYVQTMTQALKDYPDASLIFCKTKIINKNGKLKFSFPDFIKKFIIRHKGPIFLEGEKGIQQLLKGNFIFCPSLIYNLKRLNKCRFDSSYKMVQDLDFVLKVLEGGGKIVGIDEEAYLYRRHGNNATSAYTQSLLRFKEESLLYLNRSKLYFGRGWNRTAKLAQNRTIIKLNLIYCILVDMFKLNLSQCIAKILLYKNIFLISNKYAKKV